MPWAYPPGGNRLADGAPFLATRFLRPGSAAIPLTTNYRGIMYSPYEQRLVLYFATLQNTFAGMESAIGDAVVFTNNPAMGFAKQVNPDHARQRGFVFTGSATPGPWRADRCDPATAVFTQMAAPPSTAGTCFSLVNGQTCAVQNGGAGIVYVSTDGGLSWPTTVIYTINGNTDIVHGNQGPRISYDGTVAAFNSTQGLGFARDISLGTPGLIGVCNTGFIINAGDFNRTGSVFVFAHGSVANGAVYVTTDYNNFAAIPAQNNPFTVDNTTGVFLGDIVYSPVLRGWILVSNGLGGTVGFMSENDLTRIYPGLWANYEEFANLDVDNAAIDQNGDFICVGGVLKAASSVKLTL